MLNFDFPKSSKFVNYSVIKNALVSKIQMFNSRFDLSFVFNDYKSFINILMTV